MDPLLALGYIIGVTAFCALTGWIATLCGMNNKMAAFWWGFLLNIPGIIVAAILGHGDKGRAALMERMSTPTSSRYGVKLSVNSGNQVRMDDPAIRKYQEWKAQQEQG